MSLQLAQNTALPRWEHVDAPVELEEIFNSQIGLTTRDIDVLQSLLEHRFLMTEQIVRMHFRGFNSPRAAVVKCRQRMHVLFEAGLVVRYRPKLPPGYGTSQYLYTLSTAGFRVLRHLRGDDYDQDLKDLFFRPENNYVELSRIIHELELNNFCLDVCDELNRRGYKFEWIPTRLTRQTFQTSYGKPAKMEPDAVFVIETDKDEKVLHIEYERSADRRRFRQKLERWNEYRKTGSWRVPYGREPFILVVGNDSVEETDSTGRKNRTIHSIRPLYAEATRAIFPRLVFLTLEEREQGGWNCLPYRSPKGQFFTLTLWEHLGL